ncbi:MAG: hypothetical protein EOO57_00700 [Hymenobacter sp.]|nr:MAG: hypothetical protein EOO57_00700 [Hymenobacter sp.]
MFHKQQKLGGEKSGKNAGKRVRLTAQGPGKVFGKAEQLPKKIAFSRASIRAARAWVNGSEIDSAKLSG